MGVHIEDNKLVITTETKTYHLDFPKDVDNNLNHKTDRIIKNNELLAGHTIENEVRQLFPKYKHKNDIHNTKNSKTNEPHKFFFNLSQRLGFKSSNKHVALQNLAIYYTWKNKRQQYKNNKLKKITPTSINEFELPDGLYSVSDFQDYIEYVKKHEKH